MPRVARKAPGGRVYHVLNRAIGKARLFDRDEDFEAFQRAMVEVHSRHPIRILAYCLLSNHWHFVVWPQADDEVTNYFRWLAHTHAMRWRVAHRAVGQGHLYQGRFKNFPVQSDAHLLTVLRYVERNALTAGLVERAEDWKWCSLWARSNRDKTIRSILAPWPVERPRDWLRQVNTPVSAGELRRLRTSIERGRPYGEASWVEQTVAELGLEHTVRPTGRPPRRVEPDSVRGH